MPPTWSHPEWGKFEYDGIGWTTMVIAPAFGAFAYDTGSSKAQSSVGKYRLMFEADNEDVMPSPASVALAVRLLANQKYLVHLTAEAIWRDFSGKEPHSGMWWHGNLAEVVRSMGATEQPAGALELLKLMRLSQISVRKRVHGYEGAVAELSFAAPFEEEHGVGVLTDGLEVLGIGYSSDVAPFKQHQR